MNRFHLNVLLGASMIALALTVPAWAGHFGGHHGHGGGFHGKGGGPMGFRFLDALNLTDAQRSQIKDILSNHKDTIKTNFDKLATARQSMAQIMHSENLDENALRQAFQSVADIRMEMVVLRAKIIQEIRPILTAEQIELWNTLPGRRCHRAQERFQDAWDRFEKWLDEPSV